MGVGVGKVVLVGLPGSGKTTVGKAIHDLFGWSWVDVDSKIEQSTGRSITEIIRVEGEQHFRSLEAKALREAIESDAQVISVGGGALVKEENEILIHSVARPVYLKVSPRTAALRVIADAKIAEQRGALIARPLLFDEAGSIRSESEVEEKIRSLYEKRAEKFSKVGIALWTDFATPEVIAKFLVRLFENPWSVEGRIAFPCSPHSAASAIGTPVEYVHVTNGAIGKIAKETRALTHAASKIAVIIDENVLQQFGDRIKQSLEQEGYRYCVITVSSGEKSKALDQVESIIDQLMEKGIGKQDTILAVGGGVVGDLGGLVASLFMRGVKLIHMPTTLVAQVDSAIGGKTAVNSRGGKNIIGTFYPAELVFIDSSTLSTLPEREYLSGLGEVVKYGLIASETFYHWLEQNAQSIVERKAEALLEIIEFSVNAKLKVVMADLYDTYGLRAVLNFGHTFGHAIENLCGYGKLLHGEAVSIGMIQALNVGELLGVTDSSVRSKVAFLLRQLGLPTDIPAELLKGAAEFRNEKKILTREEVISQKLQRALATNEKNISRESLSGEFENRWLQALTADKKRNAGFVNFILIEKIGKTRVEKVSLENLLRCLAWSAGQDTKTSDL